MAIPSGVEQMDGNTRHLVSITIFPFELLLTWQEQMVRNKKDQNLYFLMREN
jgi:hypothetical protein